MLSNHKGCGICRIISTEKERRKKLAELARIVNGEDQGPSINVAPVLPMNRYKYGLGNRKVKDASSIGVPKRIILYPKKQEMNRRLAELARFVKG